MTGEQTKGVIAKKRDTPEEIAGPLQQVEVLVGQDMQVAGAIRPIGVTGPTYYRWRGRSDTLGEWSPGSAPTGLRLGGSLLCVVGQNTINLFSTLAAQAPEKCRKPSAAATTSFTGRGKR